MEGTSLVRHTCPGLPEHWSSTTDWLRKREDQRGKTAPKSKRKKGCFNTRLESRVSPSYVGLPWAVTPGPFVGTIGQKPVAGFLQPHLYTEFLWSFASDFTFCDFCSQKNDLGTGIFTCMLWMKYLLCALSLHQHAIITMHFLPFSCQVQLFFSPSKEVSSITELSMAN